MGALVALSLATGAPAHADSGKVIDGTTGKPLAGVHVIAIWNARAWKGIESSHSCFYLDAAETNARGEFAISSWSWNLVPMYYDRRRSLLFYARGYKGPESEPIDGETYMMLPDDRTGLDRLRYIGDLAGSSHCGNPGRQQAILKPYYRSVYEESMEIARKPEELRWVNSALVELEILELGYDQAIANARKRRRESEDSAPRTVTHMPPEPYGAVQRQ